MAAALGWWLPATSPERATSPITQPVLAVQAGQHWPANVRQGMAGSSRQGGMQRDDLQTGMRAHLVNGPSMPDPPSAPDVRARNGPIDIGRLTASRPIAAEALLHEVLLMPQPDGGFRVTEVEPDGVYAKMGLQVDDVLVSMDTPAMLAVDEHSMTALTEQTVLELNILRNGGPMVLRYALNLELGGAAEAPPGSAPTAPEAPAPSN